MRPETDRRTRRTRRFRLTRGLSVAVLIALGALPAAAQFPPERLENLQVLPEDTDVRALIGIMRGFSMGLGVRCQHCHVGDPAAPMSETDFKSDDKEAKRTARTMLRMTQAINGSHLSELEREESSRLEVRCVTCHRGQPRPAMLGEVLTAALESGGVEAAAAKYRTLREEFYGGHSFDFTEWSLIMLGESLVGSDPAAAEAMLELNLEYFPESTSSWDFLAEFYRRQDRIDEAKNAVAKALAIDPEDRRAKQILSMIEESEDAN